MYYTYAYLREDKTPYYIGKGEGNRAYVAHKRKNGQDFRPKNKNRILILKKFDLEKEAYTHEKYMISVYGLKINGGLLINLTMGGDGKIKYSTEEREEAYKNKQRERRQKNRDRERELARKRREKNREKRNEVVRKNYWNKREEKLKYAKEYREKNREEINKNKEKKGKNTLINFF